LRRFRVGVKHPIIFLKRISVTADWRGILRCE
jgi:hypothetical protein